MKLEPSVVSRAGNSQPAFSVVIVVHRDSPLVSSAIRSLRCQDCDPAWYETLVVNQSGVCLPADVEDAAVSVLTVQDADYGPKLAAVLPRCRGEFVLPLEYDDEWESSRLTTIAREIGRVPSLGFFSNSVMLIDSKGDRFFPAADPEVPSSPVNWFQGSAVDLPTLRHNIHSITYHGSALAISRQLLSAFSDDLRRIHTSIPAFSLYLALNSDLGLAVDSRRLTLYRIHNRNSSRPRTREARLRLAQDCLEDFRIILEVIERAASPVGADLVREKARELESVTEALRTSTDTQSSAGQ